MQRIATTLVVALFLLLLLTTLATAQEQNADGRSVTYIPADQVTQAVENSGLIASEPDFSVIGVHRDQGEGQPEAHANVTDIYYILTGTATLVTGGQLEGSTETETGEFLGGELTGGTERRLRPGDVVVIPPGIPHWYKDVPDDLTYYLVQVIRLQEETPVAATQ